MPDPSAAATPVQERDANIICGFDLNSRGRRKNLNIAFSIYFNGELGLAMGTDDWEPNREGRDLLQDLELLAAVTGDPDTGVESVAATQPHVLVFACHVNIHSL